ncbi:tape measure protein [Shinella sp.]|uniref:tape measure protein n=1 Tax=Shinella sp. TaxID=1870904 RepID=UPI00301E1D65
MATDIERLIVALEARTKAFENALARANSTADKRARSIERRFEAVNKNVSASFSSLGRGLIAGVAGSVLTREFIRLSESATRMNNSLKVAGVTGADLDRVYNALADAARKNGAPVEALVSLYGRAAQAQRELGVSTDELIQFSSNVALALRVAGTDASAASGALLQLGQALGSGKVQAEEFNSILEGAPTIAQAAAAGLKEASGSVSQLKSLVVDGKISSEAFFRAFEAGAVVLEEKAARSTLTLGGATENLQTALVTVVRDFITATNVSERFAGGINTAADAIASFDVASLIQKIRDVRDEFSGMAADFGNAEIWKKLSQALGVADEAGSVLNPDISATETKIAGLERELELLQERIETNSELGFDNTEALARIGEVQAALAQLRATAANLPQTVDYTIGEDGLQQTSASNFQGPPKPPTGVPPKPRPPVKQVSIEDFRPPPGKSSGGSGRRGGRGGGGGRGNEYEREIQQIKERTEALQAETAAQASVNPLIDDYDFAITKARSSQELLTAAKRAGLTITPELEASIEQLADGYAKATEEANRLSDSQDRVKRAAADMRSFGKDLFGGFISDIRNGVSASEALANALNKVLDKIIDISLNSIFGDGSSGVGGFGDIFKMFFHARGGIAAHGRQQPIRTFAGGGISRSAAIFGEAGPEAAVPLPDGRRIPVDLRMPGGQTAGSQGVTTVNIIDNAGVEKQQQRRRGSNGEEIIDVIISRVKDEFASGGFDKSMGGRFGARPVKVTR